MPPLRAGFEEEDARQLRTSDPSYPSYRHADAGESVVQWRCGTELAMSRGYRERLQDRVGQL
jgi:hypothetical protein